MIPTTQLKDVCDTRTYKSNKFNSKFGKILIKPNRDPMKSIIEIEMTIKMFNMNLNDFSEKAGIKRKSPRTKATFAAAMSIPNPVLDNKDPKVV